MSINTITLKIDVAFNGRVFQDANEVLALALEALAEDVRCYSGAVLTGKLRDARNRVELGTFTLTNKEASA